MQLSSSRSRILLGIISALWFQWGYAQALPEEPWSEDYGVTAEHVQETEEYDFYPLSDSLFTDLIPAHFRKTYPNEAYKSYRVHLKDSFGRFPKLSQIQKDNLKFVRRIMGNITYVGIVKKKYIYDILKSENDEWVIQVRVHFKNATAQDFAMFQNKMKMAENIWNQNRVPFDFNYQFHFIASRHLQGSHFSVNVKDSSRGPYDTTWARNWNASVIAHEIGHMMGLGDEYKTLSGEIDCLRNSLMCSSWSGDLMLHHYYFILRRLTK